ncbi:MAG: hypothetical protein WC593_00110 [Methanoregula sp.]
MIQSFAEMKHLFQAGLEGNKESLMLFGATYSKQLKAYLIESNLFLKNVSATPDGGRWVKLDVNNWYVNSGGDLPGTLFLDTSRKRVWILYSLMKAKESDDKISSWISVNQGLDKCWLSHNHLMHFQKSGSWIEKGIGLNFSDGLTPKQDAGKFSLKAWYGLKEPVPGVNEFLALAKEKIAINSIRWQKRSGGSVKITEEWYSNGKVTVNQAEDAEEVMISISEIANRYEDALFVATDNRDKKLCAFELNFTKTLDLDAFSEAVAMGKSGMNLWLIEIESSSDFKRFKGVDLHTWDRVFMDVGLDYAYLTIPGNGCVNAAPRIATVQGEDNAGRTSIFFDGVEMFA